MKLDDILDMWSTDCDVDRTELGEEALKIPKLHSKYLRHFSEERLLLRKLEQERKELVLLKNDYYRGILSEEDLKSNGWEPFRLSVLKSDVPTYIEADQDVIKLNLRIECKVRKLIRSSRLLNR